MFSNLRCKILGHDFELEGISEPYEYKDLVGIDLIYKCNNCGVREKESMNYRLNKIYDGENIDILLKLIEEKTLIDGIYVIGEVSKNQIFDFIDKCKGKYMVSFNRNQNEWRVALVKNETEMEMSYEVLW